MSTPMKKELSCFSKITKKLRTPPVVSFFNGRLYPVLVAAMVFLGHTLGIEIYLLPVNMLLFAAAMIATDTVRPLIVVLCTFLYQVPLAHTPGGPVWSDHYLTGIRPFFIGFSVVVIMLTVVYIIVKYKIFVNLKFRDTPLLLSSVLMGIAFMLGGAFSSSWRIEDLGWGFLQAILFPALFLVFYKGLTRESDLQELGAYVAYVSAVIGVLLALEMADLYIFGNDYYGTIFDSSGSVIKDRIHLGWATWNPAGVAIAVLIPMIFYGVIKSKYTWAYILCAVFTYIAALMTFSRNALIFATLAFIASVVITCVCSKGLRRKVFVLITVFGALIVLAGVVVLFDKIVIFARDIFNRGFSDNGRFNVWRTAIENFKTAPVFGTGYYHFWSPELYNYSPAIPLMAHQTVLQLLSATGFVGLAAYLYYRLDSVEMFFCRPTLLKSMLGLSVLVLLLESLLDNFIFTIFPLFYYSVALAVVALIYERQISDAIPVQRRSGLSRKRRRKK